MSIYAIVPSLDGNVVLNLTQNYNHETGIETAQDTLDQTGHFDALVFEGDDTHASKVAASNQDTKIDGLKYIASL